MQAVILAGGLGTRLKTLSGDLPKPLMPINGAPFLLHQIRMLRRHGFADFLFLISYASDTVIEFLREYAEGEGAGCVLDWSVEPEPLGTAGAVGLAAKKLHSEFFLLNGDSYLDLDYHDMAEQFAESGARAMLAVYDNSEDTDVPPNVLVDSDLMVRDYQRDDKGGRMTHVDAGVVALRSDVAALIEPDTKCSMENDVYGQLMSDGGMRAYLTGSRFYDIGTPSRCREFEEVVRRGLS